LEPGEDEGGLSVVIWVLINHFEVQNKQAYQKQIAHCLMILPFIAFYCLSKLF